MLTYTDQNIVKRIIERRLGKEPGVSIIEVIVNKLLTTVPIGIGENGEPVYPPDNHIKVGILFNVRNGDEDLIIRSVFDLPPEFEHRHVINEVDEICEQAKAARKDYGISKHAGYVAPERAMLGTGLRGRWKIA